MITLYDYALSADCYKLRLLMALLRLPCETVDVDYYPGRQHRAPWFLELNPLGTLPVIEDGGLVLNDAQAILGYLAAKYDTSETWYPRRDPALLGRIAMWLGFAASLAGSAGAARLHDGMFHDCDIEKCRADAHDLFRILDGHLWFAEQAGEMWICGGELPTIADIACFPDIMLSEEGGISRQEHPALRRWTDRIRRLPGFVQMSGIFPLPAS